MSVRLASVISYPNEYKGPKDFRQRLVLIAAEREAKQQQEIPKRTPPAVAPAAPKEAQEPSEPVRMKGENAILHIQRVVAHFYRMSLDDLVHGGRKVAHQRQVSMYLCKIRAGKSYPEIAARHGITNHTTAFYAYSKIAWLIGAWDGDRPPKYFANKEVPIDEVIVGEVQSLKRLLEDL